MNKKLMAVAVAGALAAPGLAMAQAGTNEAVVYGRFNVGIDNWKATGANAGSTADFKSRMRVYDSGSRVGFRGKEDLGGGLRAVFQIETGVNTDTGTTAGQSGANNSSSGTWATRDSYGGLEGDSWGRVSFGRQSIFWVTGINGQSGANYVQQDVNSTGYMGRTAGPTARTNNVLAYNSPTWGGINFTASYAPQGESAAANANTNAKIYGATVRYFGIVNAQLDWAASESQQPAAGATPKNTGTKVSVGWPYARGANIALIYIQNKNDNVGSATGFTANDSIKQSAAIVNWEQIFGNIQALAEFGRVGDATGCSASTGVASCTDTGATAYLLAARYLFSKRTAAYFSYLHYSNKANANWDFNGAGMSSGGAGGIPVGSVGADPQSIALGVIHNF